MSIITNICYLIIFCQFVIFPGKTHTPNEVKVHIKDGEKEFVINLKKVVSYLANENLPVWTVSKDADSKLIPDRTVMTKLKQFSMYQDPDHSSATVYYNKLQRMYGTVEVCYAIRSLPVTNLNNPYYVTNANSGVVERKSGSCLHRSKRSSNEKHLKTFGEIWPNVSGTLIRPRRDLPEVVYVKVLILVNYELTQKLRPQSDESNAHIVFELLNLFNSVDMLFSKVVKPKIRINIAGIIVGTTPESFPKMNKCYKKNNNYMNIDPVCSNLNIKKYVQSLDDKILPDSFDVAIFLTRYTPLYTQFFSKYYLGGATDDSTSTPYQMRKAGANLVPVISALYLEKSGSFHIIAHELAHALKFNEHDKGPYVDGNDKCNAYLMKTTADYCKNCLSWSPSTRIHFKIFFKSRERCFFINTPLSLEKQEPRIIWTADEQCKCYGYYEATYQDVSLLKKILGVPNAEMCNTNLYCLDKDGKSHEVPYPMDGTPCTPGGVCWKRKCQKLQNDEEHETSLK
ncbi:hypothetical protein PV327_010855 [Microctonus hyperodae]|uniref:Peptidase M12B domain-containing protein n=1 Tax=Microctonus hyperodae TaxID=165561 RepID=A0AA39EZ94_MICHY|nr:hypothetical protein PV327_010855 [Microctonus hyperodae]